MNYEIFYNNMTFLVDFLIVKKVCVPYNRKKVRMPYK